MLTMPTTKVSDKYQVVIPKHIRERLKLKRGERLTVVQRGHDILLGRTRKLNWPDDYIGLHADIWKGVDTADYIRTERASWDKE